MNSRQTTVHRVERTRAGRFAVVAPDGDVLAELCDEALAIASAAALDAEPVRTVTTQNNNGRGRWDEQPIAA